MWAQQNQQLKQQIPLGNTLSSCINEAVGNGFEDHFKVTGRGLYSCLLSRYYRPEQVNIVNSYRIEDESEAGKYAIVYVLETSDGTKGTLIDVCDTGADGSVSRFMAEADGIRKRMLLLDRNEC